MPFEELVVRTGEREYKIEIDRKNTGTINIDGRKTLIEVRKLHNGVVSILIDGKSYLFEVSSNGESYNVGWGGGEADFEIEDDRTRLMNSLMSGKAGKKRKKRVHAPMPGLVVKIMAGVGDHVEKGDALVVVEAMKMENEISSPSKGKVAEVLVEEKQPVEKDEVMITLEG